MSEGFVDYLKSLELRTKPYRLTRYEKARIVAARALQLSLGAVPLIDIRGFPKDPVVIAMEELRRGLLPITVVRRRPTGEVELVPVNKLVEVEHKLFGRVYGLEASK
ncbi:MAG: DNA-directed RNA polymerase subunit K [Zestosphaera sp.]